MDNGEKGRKRLSHNEEMVQRPLLHPTNGNEETGCEKLLFMSKKNDGVMSLPRHQKEFDELYNYTDYEKEGLCEKVKKKKYLLKPKNVALSIFPILRWLPRYKWHSDLMADVVAGLTVAVMHIPQGLAYAILAGVPAVTGIYTAIFPVFIYSLMGTSRQISPGTFALVCLMAGKLVVLYGKGDDDSVMVVNNATSAIDHGANNYTPNEVAAAICLVVGLWQTVLSLMRMGSLCVFLSEYVTSGLIAGAAIVVIASQLKHLFGLKLPQRVGFFSIVFTISDIFHLRNQINYTAFAITVSVFTVLILYDVLLKARLSKVMPIPLPTELLVIMLGVVASHYFKLSSNYGITTVGYIPAGLPSPAIPSASLVPKLLWEGFAIAVIAYSINISMASVFAEKHRYRVNTNQELLAAGCANIFSSFFQCVPFSSSLSRSLIQDAAGGKTQLAGLVSCAALIIVLLFVSPLFEALPHCVLTGIIYAAMKGMTSNFGRLMSAWKESKVNGAIWLLTFFSVVFIDIVVGLLAGVAFSLIYITALGQKTKAIVLGRVPDTEIYVDLKRYRAASQVPGILILQLVAGLNFANKESARQSIYKKVNKFAETKISCVILDMSSVSYIDPSSVKCLTQIHDDLKSRNISLRFCKFSHGVLRVLMKCGFFDQLPGVQLFPSIHDAVILHSS